MTIDQLKTNLQSVRPNAQWIVNSASSANVLYADLTWLDQVQTKPTAQALGF